MKPIKTIEKMYENKQLQSPEEICAFLWDNINFLQKVALGEVLGSSKELMIETSKLLVGKMNLSGQTIDNGLRLLLDHFRLPG